MHFPAPPVPRVRRPGFDFRGLPRRWLGGRGAATRLVNALNLVFPAGEQFFVRSVRHYLDRIEDPRLRQRVAGFIGQEARHGYEHRVFCSALEAQGYELESFLESYTRLAYEVIEPAFDPIYRLSTTAALEHMTASLGLLVLRHGALDEAHEAARQLLTWHAAEEVEHRSVAYDVLQEVDPRYRIRLAGFGLALGVLGGFFVQGTWHLARQDAQREGWLAIVKEMVQDTTHAAFRKGLLGPGLLEVLSYLRPGFPPDQGEDYQIALDYLRAAEASARWADREAQLPEPEPVGAA